MQFLKVACASCTEYRSCPQLTRLFVNYCGADVKRVAQKIHAAASDCRTRRSIPVSYTMVTALPGRGIPGVIDAATA